MKDFLSSRWTLGTFCNTVRSFMNFSEKFMNFSLIFYLCIYYEVLEGQIEFLWYKITLSPYHPIYLLLCYHEWPTCRWCCLQENSCPLQSPKMTNLIWHSLWCQWGLCWEHLLSFYLPKLMIRSFVVCNFANGSNWVDTI